LDAGFQNRIKFSIQYLEFISPYSIMLSTFVKISNVTNLSDARYCAGMGVDMLGFSIDENSSSYVAPKKYAEIRAWVAGVQLVVESSETDPKKLLALLTEYEFEALQVEDPDLLVYLKSELDKPLLLRVDVDHYEADELDSLMGRYAGEVAYFLLESAHETILTEEWKAYLATLGREYPILLGFGLDQAETTSEFVENMGIGGIALRGGAELRPGYKDFGALMDMLEALETEG
jgi:phosphoribosylanthranilate isomerase